MFRGVGVSITADERVPAGPGAGGWCLLVCLAWLAFGVSGVAHAGLYQCAGPHGETVFTGDTSDYTNCHAVNTPDRSAPTTSNSTAPDGTRVLRGSVYRVQRADGSTVYTNVKPAGGRSGKVKRLFTYVHRCAACAVHSDIDWSKVPLNLHAYAGAVQGAVRDYDVNPAFLRAIIHAESAYHADALSTAGAEGLMQLMPATATEMGVDDAFNGSENIDGGAHYLSELLDDFDGDRRLAAAAYNAGPNAVRKYDGVPPYSETKVYVKRVHTLYERYAKALDNRPSGSS